MNYFEKRKRRKESERRVQARLGRKTLQRHIAKQGQREREYFKLAKRAYRLNDRPTFLKVAKSIANIRQDIKRCEQLTLTFDLFEAERDKAQAGAGFMEAMGAMAKSMEISADPATMAEILQRTEQALALGEEMEDSLGYLMEMTDESLAGIDAEQEAELSEIMRSIAAEAEEEGEPGFEDEDIDAIMKKIDEDLQRRLG